MATWSEVVSFVNANYVVSDQSSDFMELLFETGNGRSQLVFIGGSSEIDVCWVSSPFAKTDDITPQQFAACSQNSILGLKRIGEELYSVHHVVPLENLDASEIAWAFDYVTNAADQLERQLGLGDKF